MQSPITSHLELLQRLAVLLVEDNPGDADLVREALSDTGVALDHVVRLGDALTRSAEPPDLVLLDLGLPDSSGFEGLERLRAAMPSVPIIVLTNLDDVTTGVAAVQRGAEDYLTKYEISAAALKRVMCYAVERARSRERDTLLAAERGQRDEAQRANESKDRFLAVLSHELRNPLGPIRFALDILRNPAADTGTITQARDVMERQVTHLVRLVDDLLDVSRINQNKLKLRKESVSLAHAIESAVETVMPALNAGRHHLSLALPRHDTMVHADHARVAQILVNLLNNAGKFTPAGSEIWLEAAEQDGQVVITVRDSGIGFESGAADRLFEMFHQELDGPGNVGGLGIGLTLAKELAELHGGTIEAHSDGRGQGARFTVRLPLGITQPAPEYDAAQRPILFRAARPIRVLIVDDNADSADMLAILVRELGCETGVSYEPDAALRLAAKFVPDVGLLDIGLPGMTGYELAQRMRGVPGCAKMKLVAITGWGQREDKRRAALAGFDVHLTKPIAFQQLEAMLHACQDRGLGAADAPADRSDAADTAPAPP